MRDAFVAVVMWTRGPRLVVTLLVLLVLGIAGTAMNSSSVPTRIKESDECKNANLQWLKAMNGIGPVSEYDAKRKYEEVCPKREPSSSSN